VELEASAKVRIVGASRQFIERIVLQRIEAAEPDQTVREFSDLLTGPVVLTSELLRSGVCLARWLLEDVGRRENYSAPDPCRVELRNQVGRRPRLRRCYGWRRRHQRGKLWAEQVLMVIGERRRQGHIRPSVLRSGRSAAS